MPSGPKPGRALLLLAAVALAGGALRLGWPYARLARMRFSPREDLELKAVSADGTRMILIERPSLRAFEVDADGERPLPSGLAVRARLGPGVAYIADLDLFKRPGGSFVGLDPQCELGPSPDSPWSMPVWRADGLAMLRLTSKGIVLDGPGPCQDIGDRWTSAAFVGPAVAGSDGATVWLDDRPLWSGAEVHLLMAAGTAWLQAREGFAELSAAGVQMRETNPGDASVWEMPHGVCLVDDSPDSLSLADPPTWGARCWRAGSASVLEHPRGVVPVDVDLAYEASTHTLRDLTTGTSRPLPASFPVFHSTRALPDGRLRSFDAHGYWQLGVDDVVSEVRWKETDPEPGCRECPEPTWRSPAEIR